MEEESKLCLRQLKDHIRQNHPKKNNEEWWPLSTPIGSIFNSDSEISEPLKDIGLGLSLYLLTLRALG